MTDISKDLKRATPGSPKSLDDKVLAYAREHAPASAGRNMTWWYSGAAAASIAVLAVFISQMAPHDTVETRLLPAPTMVEQSLMDEAGSREQRLRQLAAQEAASMAKKSAEPNLARMRAAPAEAKEEVDAAITAPGGLFDGVEVYSMAEEAGAPASDCSEEQAVLKDMLLAQLEIKSPEEMEQLYREQAEEIECQLPKSYADFLRDY